MLRIVSRVLQILHFVGYTYGHCPLCTLCSCAQPGLAQYVGKGHQQGALGPQICSDIDAAARAGYVFYRALVIE